MAYRVGEKVNYRQRNGYLEPSIVVKVDGSIVHVEGEDGNVWRVHEANSAGVSRDWIETQREEEEG